MPSSTKSRERICSVGKSLVYHYQFPGGKTSGGTKTNHYGPFSGRHVGRQYTASESHPRAKNGSYYEGGPFYSVDVRYDISPAMVDIGDRIDLLYYKGPIYAPAPSFPWGNGVSNADISNIRDKDTSNLDPLGATAISIISPTNPYSNVAQQLGEIYSDGIKRSVPGYQTWKHRNKLAKAAGSEYLSAVFGWLPLVDEVRNTADVVRSSDERIEIHESGAGRNTRREFEYPIEKTVSSSTSSARAQTGTNIGLGIEFHDGIPAGELTTVTESTVRRWFSGAFTYPSYPKNDSLGRMRNAAQQAEKLFGIQLTPDVMWELTPWSWAADWFSNTGDVINNFTQFAINGLIMRYGYVMEETTMKITNSLDRAALFKKQPNLGCPSSSLIVTSKVRRPANPFGFGVGWEDLSPSQLLITAALGITRLR